MYGGVGRHPAQQVRRGKTVKPWLCSSEATAFQLDPSAHAPWTRTIVGFGIGATYSVTARWRSNS